MFVIQFCIFFIKINQKNKFISSNYYNLTLDTLFRRIKMCSFMELYFLSRLLLSSIQTSQVKIN
jgi:hypothetical protein